MRHIDAVMDMLGLIRQRGPSAILFYADWCPFSMMMRNSFDAVESEHPGVTFAKARLDVIGHDDLLLPINSIPTLALFFTGKILDTVVGVVSPAKLSERIGHFELVTAGQETTAGATRVRDTVRCDWVISLEVPGNLLRYQARSRASVVDVSTGLEVGYCTLDCNETVVLLFFHYLRTCDVQGGLFANGELTTRCQSVVRSFKRDHGINGERLPGIERPEDGEPKYLAKQISRVNCKMRRFVSRVIERENGEYRLATGVKLRVTK